MMKKVNESVRRGGEMNDNWISRKRKSPFVELFPSQIPNGHWCPSFWYAKPVYGCSHRCVTCFMHNLKNKYDTPNTVFDNIGDLRKELIEWDKNHSQTMLCFGTETADMLKDRAKIIKVWKEEPESVALDVFKGSSNKALFLTKSKNIGWFLKTKPCDNIVISFSINGIKAGKFWERNTCSMESRLEAIEKLISLGWSVRVRVDPLLIDADFFRSDIKEIAEFINRVNIQGITSGVMRRNKRPIFNLQRQLEGIGYFFNLLTKEKQKLFMVCKADLEVIDILKLKGHNCNCMYGHNKLSDSRVTSKDANGQLSFI